MATAVPELDIELPDIDQIALVVEDLRGSLAAYHDVLGVGPWTVYRYEPPRLTDMTYLGEEQEYGMVLGLAEIGSVTLELVEPTIGPNIYYDHLEEQGEGLHHVAYFSWSEEETYEVNATLEDAGIPLMQSGNYQGVEYFYYDTREVLGGLIFETGILRNVEEHEPEYMYPEEAGTDGA